MKRVQSSALLVPPTQNVVRYGRSVVLAWRGSGSGRNGDSVVSSLLVPPAQYAVRYGRSVLLIVI